MKTTLMSLHGASAAPCTVVPPAALLQGTGASTALRFRTDLDGTVVADAGVDAAPPPRGAPV